MAHWFKQPGPVLVRTTKEEKVGWMLADCYREGAPSLCTELLQRIQRGSARGSWLLASGPMPPHRLLILRLDPQP